ncbi:hypothetical protein [Bacillus sp. NPDC077027]|uniref:hypothetical protein n=1 Tax=Bacillus sp. NPDC077027 TaxID=3390548 RepID=UPI003D02332E
MKNTTDIKEPVLKKIIEGMVLIADTGISIDKAVEEENENIPALLALGLLPVASEIDEQLNKYYTLGGTDDEIESAIQVAIKGKEMAYMIGIAAVTAMAKALEEAE